MTNIIQRFFQLMNTIADEANMPDYSYLLHDFDGTAVKAPDPNHQHLIDTICRNQLIRDQKLRLLHKTHNAANTLIMTRGFSVAEGKRERYLAERYSDGNEKYVGLNAENAYNESQAKLAAAEKDRLTRAKTPSSMNQQDDDKSKIFTDSSNQPKDKNTDTETNTPNNTGDIPPSSTGANVPTPSTGSNIKDSN